jgi:hypothetical protein
MVIETTNSARGREREMRNLRIETVEQQEAFDQGYSSRCDFNEGMSTDQLGNESRYRKDKYFAAGVDAAIGSFASQMRSFGGC